MNRDRVRQLFNNGILKAWLDGKTLQYQINDKWTDLVYSNCTDDLSGLNLRIKPEPIKQTLEWFSFADCKPDKLNTPIIFSQDDAYIIVKLNNNQCYSIMYNGYEYVPINGDYWTYITFPVDIPF